MTERRSQFHHQPWSGSSPSTLVRIFPTAIDRAPAALHAAVSAELTVEQRILAQLEAAAAPLTAVALRKLCQIRNATLQTALAALVADGQLRKDRAGYVLTR